MNRLTAPFCIIYTLCFSSCCLTAVLDTKDSEKIVQENPCVSIDKIVEIARSMSTPPSACVSASYAQTTASTLSLSPTTCPSQEIDIIKQVIKERLQLKLIWKQNEWSKQKEWYIEIPDIDYSTRCGLCFENRHTPIRKLHAIAIWLLQLVNQKNIKDLGAIFLEIMGKLRIDINTIGKVEDRQERSGTLLHWAVAHGNYPLAELALTAGASPDVRDSIGATSLWLLFDPALDLTIKDYNVARGWYCWRDSSQESVGQYGSLWINERTRRPCHLTQEGFYILQLLLAVNADPTIIYKEQTIQTLLKNQQSIYHVVAIQDRAASQAGALEGGTVIIKNNNKIFEMIECAVKKIETARTTIQSPKPIRPAPTMPSSYPGSHSLAGSTFPLLRLIPPLIVQQASAYPQNAPVIRPEYPYRKYLALVLLIWIGYQYFMSEGMVH